MLFGNKKFRLIACSVFYGLFVIATAVLFIIGCADMDKANSINLMHVVVCIAILAVPYFLFLHADQFEGKAGKIATGIVAQALLWFLILIVLLCCFSADNRRTYPTLCLSSLLSTTISMAVFNLRAGITGGGGKFSLLRKDSVEDGNISANVCYFIAFAAPFLSYPLAMLLFLLPVRVAAMAWGAIFVCSYAFTMMSDFIAGKIVGAVAVAAIVIVSIVFGAQRGMDYGAAENTLVLAPCLAVLFTAALIGMLLAYNRPAEDGPYNAYMFSVLGASVVATPLLQWLIGFKWFIGLPVLVVLIIGHVIGCRFLGGKPVYHVSGSSSSYSSGPADGYGAASRLESAIYGKLPGGSSVSVSADSAEAPCFTVRIRTARSAHGWVSSDIGGWIRGCINGMNKSFGRYSYNVYYDLYD